MNHLFSLLWVGSNFELPSFCMILIDQACLLLACQSSYVGGFQRQTCLRIRLSRSSKAKTSIALLTGIILTCQLHPLDGPNCRKLLQTINPSNFTIMKESKYSMFSSLTFFIILFYSYNSSNANYYRHFNARNPWLIIYSGSVLC